jgi:PAS domain S-box-containing protein
MTITTEHKSSPVFGRDGRAGSGFREFDWTASPLGPIAGWPQMLGAAVDLLLASPQPSFVCWGKSFILLHNAGCLAFGGGRSMLGRALASGWPAMAVLLSPVLTRVMTGGRGEVLAEQSLLLSPPESEEIFLTFSCSPLRLPEGGTGGVLVHCAEVTGAVLARRRLRAGQDLAGRLRQAGSPAAVCRQAGEVFAAHQTEIPFALLYRCEESRQQYRLASVAGLSETTGIPRLIDVDGHQRLFSRILAPGMGIFSASELGIRREGASVQARALPLLSRDGRPLGVLILGIDPRRKFDAACREFQQFLAAELAAALANAHLERQQVRFPHVETGDCDHLTAEGCRLLCESENRLRAIVDYAPAAIYVKDLCFNYMMGNERFAKITGVGRDELRGKDDFDLFTAEAAERFRNDDRQVLASGAYLETEEVVRLEDGPHTYFTVKFPLLDGLGNIYAIAGISTDITESKWAEEELRQTAAELSRSNEELEQFAYIVSHDLREPLRTMGGFLNLLQRRHGAKLDDNGLELITFAREGAERLDRMITDLLDFSRIQKRELEPKRVDLFSAWLAAVDNLYAMIEESGAHIAHDDLPVITGDESQMVRLWQNLLSNAIKFRGERRPEIFIGVTEKPAHWLFSVRDNGIGIEPQFADRIFKVFQRLHTQREYPGSGIGLAVCRKIVERHGGRIWMESHPGRGTTFYFTLTK